MQRECKGAEEQVGEILWSHLIISFRVTLRRFQVFRDIADVLISQALFGGWGHPGMFFQNVDLRAFVAVEYLVGLPAKHLQAQGAAKLAAGPVLGVIGIHALGYVSSVLDAHGRLKSRGQFGRRMYHGFNNLFNWAGFAPTRQIGTEIDSISIHFVANEAT